MGSEAYYINLIVNGVVEGLVIGLSALAINLVFAVSRFPNAATGDFLTVGAYAGFGAQQLGMDNVIVQALFAIMAGVAVSLTSYWAIFRKLAGRPMVAFLLASIGIAFFSRSVLSFFVGHEPQFIRLPMRPLIEIAGMRLQIMDLWLALVAAITVAIALIVLHWTPIGRRMRAISDNSVLAQASGIRSQRVMVTLWAMVGVVTGIAGLIFGIKATVSPELGWDVLLPSFAAAILGGVGSAGGAVLAGVVLGVLQELSTPVLGFSYKVVVSFGVLLLILLFRPQGLFGRRELVR